MKLGELIEKVDIIATAADPDLEVSSVCFDTRKQEAGCLFVAVRGYAADGHRYIAEAVEKGAVCVISEETPDMEDQPPYILVRDSRKALAAVSAAWFGYPASKLDIIGVTGTNGKTTVTSLIKQVVEMCSGGIAGLIGTNGIMIGDEESDAEHTTPESYDVQRYLAKMADAGCRYAVMEVSSHALRLDRLYGIGFEAGVYTNLSPDHLDFHDSMEDYAAAKTLLFANSRVSVINIDDAYAEQMISSVTGVLYKYSVIDDSADFVAKNMKLQADRVDFSVLTVGSLNRIVLNIPGLFSVYNAMAVISTLNPLGFEMEDISDALRKCAGVKGRAELVPTGRDFTVMIDYAHTPDALRNIIATVRGFANGRVVTLFGCGGDRDKTKRPKMGGIAAELSDFVIVTSDNPRTEKPGDIINDILSGMKDTKTRYCVIENRREAIHWALGNSAPGDVLILAGKGHETYQILGKEKTHFDEREVVAEYFAGL